MCLCLFLCCITPTVEGLQLLKLTSNSNRYLICQIYINSPFFPVAAKCVHNIRTGPLTYCVVIHLQWPLFSGQGCGESVAWGIEHWRSGGNAGRGGNTPQIFHNMIYITQYIKQTAQQQLWRLWKQWCTSVGVKERITEFGSWEIPCIPKCRDHCILCVREMQISVSVSSQKMLTWKS